MWPLLKCEFIVQVYRIATWYECCEIHGSTWRTDRVWKNMETTLPRCYEAPMFACVLVCGPYQQVAREITLMTLYVWFRLPQLVHYISVVEYFVANEGLDELDRIWRQHFLDVMHPRFLHESCILVPQQQVTKPHNSIRDEKEDEDSQPDDS